MIGLYADNKKVPVLTELFSGIPGRLVFGVINGNSPEKS
jgi:hypothetical protein